VVAPPGKVHKPSGQAKVVLGWTDRDAAIRMHEFFRAAIGSCCPTLGHIDALRHQVGGCGSAALCSAVHQPPLQRQQRTGAARCRDARQPPAPGPAR
jgi:hypothetical protein